VDDWKENILEDLEVRILEYETVGEFLMDIRKEFRRGDKESTKTAELKRLKQGGRTIEEYIQEFKRAARGSGYKGCLLIEEFKQSMNSTIRRRLIEVECQPSFIEQ